MIIIGQESNQRLLLQEWAELVCSAMGCRKSLLLERTFFNRKIQLCFSDTINLPRIRSHTNVLLRLNGTRQHMIMELLVSASEGAVGQQLSSLMHLSNNEISSLLLVNQMSLRKEQGKFLFSSQRGFVFRVDLTCMRFVMDSRKVKVYFSQKIEKSYSIFSRELQRLLTFLKGKKDENTSRGLAEQEEKLRLLREVLEKKRQFRPKSTKINLSGCAEKTTSQVLDLGFNRIKTKKITPKQLLQSEQFFDRKVKEIVKTVKDSDNFILQGMRIKSVCKQQTALCEGGFSKISRGIFDIELFASVNHESLVKVEEKQYFALVLKQQKNKEDYHALLNEQRFLVFARNHKCAHIGQYYTESKNNSYFENGIYVEHYPNNLAENTALRERQLLNIMTEIAQGLTFLNQIGVAHRDLKLHNIMVDRQRRAKLIDFGSAAPIIWNEKSKSSAFAGEVDTRMTSTEGYYLPYKQAALKCVSLGDKFTREQYQCHENFDMFSFGVVLTKKMNLNLPVVGDFVREQLFFMSKKCLEPNPDDRIRPTEAVAWLQCIEEYEWQRRCVWNYAQRKARQLELGLEKQ